jgi:hypothetical protein
MLPWSAIFGGSARGSRINPTLQLRRPGSLTTRDGDDRRALPFNCTVHTVRCYYCTTAWSMGEGQGRKKEPFWKHMATKIMNLAPLPPLASKFNLIIFIHLFYLIYLFLRQPPRGNTQFTSQSPRPGRTLSLAHPEKHRPPAPNKFGIL